MIDSGDPERGCVPIASVQCSSQRAVRLLDALETREEHSTHVYMLVEPEASIGGSVSAVSAVSTLNPLAPKGVSERYVEGCYSTLWVVGSATQLPIGVSSHGEPLA